jgi:hypothetical protein
MLVTSNNQARYSRIECESQVLAVPSMELARTSSLSGSAGVYVPPSSLVGLGITSSLSDVIDHTGVPACPDAGWLRGACEHGTIRWLPLTCKRRGCPVCGELRKKRIAWRISAGVDILGGAAGGAWLVLTFDRDVTKADAVKIANQFMQWLYRYCKRRFGFKPEWAKVWEIHQSGRLHLNIVLAPWHFIPQSVLASKWHGRSAITWRSGIRWCFPVVA